MKSVKKRLSWLVATLCAVVMLACTASVAWAEEAAYMTVYLKDTNTGAVVPVKTYTQEEFADLATPITASAMNGLTQVYTTNNAVALEDLFADAGVDVADGDVVYAAAAYGTDGEFGLGVDWTWGQMKEAGFYPNATADSYNTEGAAPTIPCLGLNYATAKDYSGTAGQAEAANLEALSADPTVGASSAPRLFLGIAADKFTADFASDKNYQGGTRCISGVNAVVVSKDMYMSVYAKGPGAQQKLVKYYGKAEFEALATPITASAMNGLTQVYTTNNAVSLEDLFADAGLSLGNADEIYAAAAYGTDSEFGLGMTWTWAAMNAGQFYPNASAESYNAEGASSVTPCLGLNNASSAKGYTGTAGEAEAANLEALTANPSTGASSAPRLFLGIAADKFSAEYASDFNIQGGKRCISGVNAMVVNQKTADNPVAKSFTYNGKTQTALKAGTGFTVSGATHKYAGSYKAVATLAEGYVWADGTTAPKTLSWKIARANQKVTGTSTVTKTYTAAKSGKYKGKIKTTRTISSLRTTFKLSSVTSKSYKVVSYSKSSTAKKYISVSKAGKVYVKKGLKKGTYTLKIKVTAAQSTNWNSTCKYITLKVRVK